MANVNSNYLFLQFMARKNQIGQVTPQEYMLAYNTSQRYYYDFLLGKVQQFQYGKPVPRVALGMDSKIAADLTPFKVSNEVIAVTANIAPYPTGFKFLALMTDSTGRGIERIDDTKLPGRINSRIDPMTPTSKPFYVEEDTGWHVYPEGYISTIKASYYVYPPDVVWNYTTVNGRPVYDPAGSVQPLWDDMSNDEIMARTCRLVGISFTEEQLVQYGEHTIKQGE